MEEKKGYLKAVGIDKSFKMKTNHGSVVAEIYDLEGLKAAIEKAPAEAILFHMDNRNDFAAWIGGVVLCSTLSEVVQKIEPNHSDVEHTRNQLIETLDLGIKIMKEIQRQG